MASPNEVQTTSYTVLYYKRKASKVHKAKGASKKDGVLSILPPPQSRITLTDGSNVVFQGILTDIAKRGKTLQEEDILNLGAYEVEVFDKHAGESTSLVGGSKSMPSKSSSLLKRKKILRIPLHPNSRPLLSKNESATTPAHGKGGGPCHANGRHIVQPPQPKSTLLDLPSSSEDESRNVSYQENTQRASMKRGFSNNKPLRILSKVRKVSTARACATTTARKTSAAPKFFVDAIGNPNVPHSIKSVLKPHQVSGVSFLWNCLTGKGKAQIASPHVSDTEVFKGVVLADGMSRFPLSTTNSLVVC